MPNTEEAETHRPSYDGIVHPKKCPGCNRVWELESQARHKCCYCKHKLFPKETSLIEDIGNHVAAYWPYALWLTIGMAVGSHWS